MGIATTHLNGAVPMKLRLLLILSLLFTFSLPLNAQYDEECDELIEDALMDYLDMDDLDDLFDYMDSLDDDDIDDLLDAVDIEALEEICKNSDSRDTAENDKGRDDNSESDTQEIVTNLSIQRLPSGFDDAFDVFEQYVSVFGVHVVATDDVPENKVLHAATVLAEYLDNDEDGEVDNPDVLDALLDNNATLILFADENRDFENFVDSVDHDEQISQPLFGFEIHPDGASRSDFDATLEEVLHLITTGGYAFAYPDVWGEERGTEVADLMENAKSAGHYDPFANEPSMDYESQVSEYIYWSLTTLLGAQDFNGRASEIRSEWSLSTAQEVENTDPNIVELLNEDDYAFPTVLPDGNYNPK